MTRRMHANLAACVVIGLACTLLLSACGVPNDEQPEKIDVPSMKLATN
ncbi:MAG: hypothetical protein Q7L55_08435 [Actinomycetota bacterium]|nr:hypothetical protein [Actinomycetota bacterium]